MLRGERTLKYKILQIVVSPIIFVTDCLNKSGKCKFCSWLFQVILKATNYPLHHFDVSLTIFRTQRSSLYIWVGETKSLFSIFFSIKTKLLALQRKFHSRRYCTWDCCISKHKCPIYVTRRIYPETKVYPNGSFTNNFCRFNLTNKETFLFCF